VNNPQHSKPTKAVSPEKSAITVSSPTKAKPEEELQIKNEQIDSQQQQLQSESISMLLCDETIPSSPAPNHQTGSIIPNVKRVYHNAAFLQPQNVTVAAAISFTATGGGNAEQSKPSSSGVDTMYTIEKSRNTATVPATSTTNVAGKTSDSSPRDSLSQDDSKSDSEDLKKSGKIF
jgi:hypothetical protein